MLPRPAPHRAFGAVRLSITVLLAVHVFISAWLVATVEGTYTEGKPAPAAVHSLVAIDKDQTMIDVEIKNATPLFFYTLTRDADASVPADNNGTDASSDDASSDAREDETNDARQTDRAWLDIGRQSVNVALVLMVLGEALMLTSLRWRHHLRSLGFFAAVAAFAIVFPACYMLELTGGTDEDEDRTASNTPGANLETVTFVHTNASSDASLTWLGFQLEADFSGYDLGLVVPENRTTVAQQVPDPGSDAADPPIAFASSFTEQLGNKLDSLLVLPFMWYHMRAMKRPDGYSPPDGENISPNVADNQPFEGGENAGN
ncbi:MAG: hypothetical protein VX996_06535 [Candidatus Thermoplasmatota archaeon]|nr:hypothetical protein [Candidatus Thermoplasmatota archaeon]